MGKMVRLAEKLAGELNRGNLEAMGWILDENWKLKQTLSEGISNERVNNWYARAKKAGALGGKLLGAGGGGFLLFDAPPEKHRAVEEALGGLRRIPFRMDPRGSRIVFVYN
jgi:D-glycero-alpha-D-manno-heptose-7-phosphate kinase